MHQAKVRKFGAAILYVLVFILMLSGCVGAGSSNNTGSSEQIPNKASEPASEQPEVRTIQTVMGPVKLEGTPQRIVVLSNEGAEAVLALGVKPVGAVKSWLGDPWYAHIANQMQDVTVVGDEMQPNLELIASLQPDLILGVKVRQEAVYKQLSAIAPTVFSETLSGEWQKNFQIYADALNKREQGQTILAEFNKRIEDAKAKLGDKTSAKVSVVRFLPGGARIYFKDSFSGVLLRQLGFARPKVQDKAGLAEEITKERIPEMDGDILFYFVWEDDVNTKTGEKSKLEWQKEQLWKNLNVVKNHKAFEVQDAIWNTSGGILAANLMLDELLQHME